jgi:broad specificity phosphatase PhoE
MTIWYVRHGETLWNREGRMQGQSDSPLTELGIALVRRYGERLRELIGETRVQLCTSPLPRARESARLIAEALGERVGTLVEDPLLMEHGLGLLEGKTWDELQRDHGISREQFRLADFVVPQGESRQAAQARALRWLTQPRESECIVVSHGMFSRTFRAAYLSLDIAGTAALPSHPHGTLFQLREREIIEHRLPAPEHARI